MNILIFGDIIGRGGRDALREFLPSFRESRKIDVVIANGENLAHGRGITPDTAGELFDLGIDVITTGNHVWDNKKSSSLIETDDRILRPANYPPGVPGQGSVIIQRGVVTIAVLNLMGRVFLREDVDDPFRAVESWLASLPLSKPLVTLVDFHAEATSEKRALGFFLDGKVTAVWGTHTHVPTGDEQILPNGTAYLTDVGIVGSHNSLLGFEIKPLLRRFQTQLPESFDVVEDPPWEVNGLCIRVQPETGNVEHIERIREICGTAA